MPGLERTLEMTILIRAINQTTGAFGGVRLAAVAALGAVGAAMAYSVKQAAAFQTGLTVLSTGAGEAAKNLQMVGNGIKQISIDTGTTTDDLLKGAFMIESAGYRGRDALNVLKVAAQGAKLENTDLGATANTLTSLLHDYGMASTQAGKAMSGLIQTEADGKMHMSDLTKAMGNVMPLAADLGVKFPEIGAAIAVMTNSGMTAMRATQNLNFALRALGKESSNAQLDALQEIGLTADQVNKSLRNNGLLDTLTLIEDAVGKKFPVASAAYNDALSTLMGGATGWNVALKLSGAHLQEMQKDIKNISAAMGNSTTLTSKWAQMQGTFNFQLDQTKASLNVLAINVGTQLLPIVERFLQWVRDNGIPILVDLINRTAGFIQWVQQGSAGALALRDAMVLLAGAVGLVKLAALVTAMRDFVFAVPELVSNLFFVGNATAGVEAAEMAAAKAADALTAAQARLGAQAELTALQVSSANASMTSSAVQSQAALIQAGTLPASAASPEAQALAASQTAAAEKVAAAQAEVDAKQAAVEAATATAGSLTLGGIITAVGGVAFIEVMVAKYLHDSGIVPDIKKITGGKDTNPDWVTHHNPADDLKKTAEQAQAVNNQINQAWKDMEGLYDYAHSHHNILGDLQDPLTLTPTDVKLQQIKSHMDDLTKPWILPTDQPNKALDATTMKAIYLKSRLNDLDNPINIPVSIGLRSIDPTILRVMQLKDQQDNASYTNIPIPPLVNSDHYTPPFNGLSRFGGGHASGILNSPFGHWAMVGERGPELMYVPRGANIYPNGTGPGGGHTINVFVSTMAGSRAEVMRMVDLLEKEIAHRFRSQTPSFALPGLT